MLANVNLGKDLRVLAQAGRVVVIGSRGPVEIDPRETVGRVMPPILGMLVFNVTDADASSIHAALYAGFENRHIAPCYWSRVATRSSATGSSRDHGVRRAWENRVETLGRVPSYLPRE